MNFRTIIYVFIALIMLPAAVSGKVVTETVSYEQGGVTLEGYLAYDDAITGKRPGVLVVHEWQSAKTFRTTLRPWKNRALTGS